MGLLPHLQNLQLEGNKLKNIRQDVIKSGTIRLLKHLRERFGDENTKIVNSNVSHIPFHQSLPDKYINHWSSEKTRFTCQIFQVRYEKCAFIKFLNERFKRCS